MKNINRYFLSLLILLCIFTAKTYAQLGAIGEFIGIGDSEEDNLGAVLTMSGNVMEKGKTGAGFVYQYIRFVAYEGNDLATSFIKDGKYNFKKYETGKSYFISHGVTEKITASVFVNEFYIEDKYFTWVDTNKNGIIDENKDTITYKSNSYKDLSQIWVQGTYQILKESDDFRLAATNILRLPTAYEEKVSGDSLAIYLGLNFSKKILKTSLLGDCGYNHYELATALNVKGDKLFSYYPGDSFNFHLALIYPVNNKFTLGSELTGKYFSKEKDTKGKALTGAKTYNIMDIAPFLKFKVTQNTVFYTSVSYNIVDNIKWGYNYGYIFGVNYLFD
ncbi:hypothetical protein HZA55_04895 [Candidatus Poribacteria bacterium]|nr:hypothetical protein [Candidatus Poribacteria bacterium]